MTEFLLCLIIGYWTPGLSFRCIACYLCFLYNGWTFSPQNSTYFIFFCMWMDSIYIFFWMWIFFCMWMDSIYILLNVNGFYIYSFECEWILYIFFWMWMNSIFVSIVGSINGTCICVVSSFTYDSISMYTCICVSLSKLNYINYQILKLML